MRPFSINLTSKIEKKLLPQDSSIRERQRFFVFLYTSFILFLVIPLNLIGLTGPDERFYFWMNSSNLLVTLITFILFVYKKIKLSTALSVLLLSSQLETTGEMLYCALNSSQYHTHLIVGNLVLSSVVIMLAVASYLQFIPVLLATIAIGGYTVCILITHDATLINFYLLFFLIFIITCALGERLIYAINTLEQENLHLKQDEAELLRFLRMNKQQVHAYIEFSKKKNPNSKEMEQLLERLNESSQRNIINSVSTYLVEKRTSMDQIAAAFPELTSTEHEICRLIMQGKKLSEICATLDKTENNITAHRGHIRKKLNLKPENNLKKTLEIRMQQFFPEW